VLGEALGLGDALDMAEAYNATNVIFELDSLIVVNAVKNKTLIRRE
jgi:ribonuclease HI